MLAFLRLVTNPGVFERPEPIGEAWQQVRAWRASESAWVPQPTERHASLLGEFLALPGVHGNLVPDAHLPALAWSTGKRSAPRMGTLPDFWDCDGLIRSHHETNYQIDCAFEEHPPMRSGVTNGGPVQHNEFILNLSSLAGPTWQRAIAQQNCTAHRHPPSGGSNARRFHWIGIG